MNCCRSPSRVRSTFSTSPRICSVLACASSISNSQMRVVSAPPAAAGAVAIEVDTALPNIEDYRASLQRDLRDAFAALGYRLDAEDVLARIARMAVTEWSYKDQAPSIRHIGPTAQDFRAAFGLGEDPLRIGTLDADGVALTVVRALEARTREMQSGFRARAEALGTENARLGEALADLAGENTDRKARFARIEALVDRR